MPAPIVRDLSITVPRGGVDPGGSVLREALVGCWTGPSGRHNCNVIASSRQVLAGGSFGATTPTVSTQTGGFHQVYLSGLVPGGTFDWWVVATDPSDSGSTQSDTQRFTVPPGALTPSITLSGIQAGTVTATGATISWTTAVAQPRGSVLRCSDPSFSTGVVQINEAAGANVTAHSVALTGLVTATRYYYRVVQPDTTGGTTISPVGAFVTT